MIIGELRGKNEGTLLCAINSQFYMGNQRIRENFKEKCGVFGVVCVFFEMESINIKIETYHDQHSYLHRNTFMLFA